MASIGHVTRTSTSTGSFKGQLKTVSINAEIDIVPNAEKAADGQPEFGPRRLYANLGRAAGAEDDDTFALIWNPQD